MYLKEIIDTKRNIKFNKIKLNSKDLNSKDLFIPFSGVENRNKFIEDAINKNCIVITDINYKHKNVFKVNNLSQEIISIFNKYYNYPLKDIKLIGITGTDGKTTTSSILSDLLNSPKIGTNGFTLNNKTYSLENTTPSLEVLYDCFNKSRNNNYKNIVMEVSSEAYLTKRIANLNFDIGILTDITKDHLDKHKTFENYLQCKLELFKHTKIAILNRDSKYYYKFKDISRLSYSYGFKKGSDLRILYYKLYFDKTLIIFKYNNKKYKLVYPLLGKFNIYNVTSCILTMLSLGYNIDYILNRFKNIKQVEGRMEFLYNKEYSIVIDYAHTTNATLNVLKYFHKYNKNIITIVGCAGDRYKEKRKEIGSIVLKYSKLGIFTSDDPRYEDVNSIINEMLSITKKRNYLKILNRSDAIKYAIDIHKQNDLILVLGKGRDNYMLINDKKIKYSDYDTIMKILNKTI
ncbi:MAG: UDP-N-acetylmuramoyl-L-alanyl-D-glutamate--2,6-diaminopimelate ligase [Bacilli bacterium]|nr:UDP-N-acetylmuramoyl-L-alanyl-D-glutamate--2,6-diaminopimelate ligase [Bacilli bacterium]